ncbi:MAG: hypothetical protein ABH834_03195 [Candidatus Altiarchaeota archaeon]
MELNWVEVSPVRDETDVIRTNLNAVLKAGELGIFEVNASNILPVVEASALLIPDVLANSETVDFHICINESSIAGGKSTIHTICGKGCNIQYLGEPKGLVCPPCSGQGDYCECETDSDCPLLCQTCEPSGGEIKHCDNSYWCSVFDDPISRCKCTVDHPEGECVL